MMTKIPACNNGDDDDDTGNGKDDDDDTGDGNDDDDNTSGNDDDDENNTGGDNKDDDSGGGNDDNDDNTGEDNNDDDDNTGGVNGDDDNNVGNSEDENKDDDQTDVEVIYHNIILDFDDTKGELSYLVTRSSYQGENNTVKDGAEVYFMVTPYEGYKIGKGELNGREVNISSGAYHVGNVSEDLTFKVIFVDENSDDNNTVGKKDDDDNSGDDASDDENSGGNKDDNNNTGGDTDDDDNANGDENESYGDTSSIESVQDGHLRILIRDHRIYIEGIDENIIVEVINIKGGRIYTGKSREVTIPGGGYYVVVAGRETRKILIR